MGLLDQIGGALGGLGQPAASQGQGQQALLMQLAMQLLQQNGGLQGVLRQFQQNGLGDLISSWVGTGSNKSFSVEQLRATFGEGQLSQLAQTHQVPEQDLLSGLSAMLPQLVDKMTPDGQVNTGDDLLRQGLGALGSLFR